MQPSYGHIWAYFNSSLKRDENEEGNRSKTTFLNERILSKLCPNLTKSEKLGVKIALNTTKSLFFYPINLSRYAIYKYKLLYVVFFSD